MSVSFTESDTAKLQVLSAEVQKWLLNRREIKRLIRSDGNSDFGPSLRAIGIVFPADKKLEIFAGYLEINRSPWVFHLYGRENYDQVHSIMRDLTRDLETNINILLEDEYTRIPFKYSGCGMMVIATAVVISIIGFALFV